PLASPRGHPGRRVGFIERGFPQRSSAGPFRVHRYEPLGGGSKDDRILASPTVRIAVGIVLREQQRSGISQKVDDWPVGLEYLHSSEVLDVAGEPAIV